jgi:glycosyltransferase involved in cell wall biosynthesis
MPRSNPSPTLDRPLRVMFVLTSMPVGGAETLLVELVRGLDRTRFTAEICCLKEPGALGEQLQSELRLHHTLIGRKWDLGVLPRLSRLYRSRQIDAVITVAAGDNMFWGRLAAKMAGVPVIISALHSTGWPDGIGPMNRLLTPWTDAFVGVANAHGRFLVEHENFPQEKVHTIYNGIDTSRFIPRDARLLRAELGIGPADPVVGIVAALRPEKNHELFLRAAVEIRQKVPETHFLIVGDGPCRPALEQSAEDMGLTGSVHFLGSRPDIPELLSAFDVFTLTSHNEASPVSILEALSTECPVVSADVGSVAETVIPGKTGYLFPAGDARAAAHLVIDLLSDSFRRHNLGANGRQRVLEHGSLDQMVSNYQRLISSIFTKKTGQSIIPEPVPTEDTLQHGQESGAIWEEDDSSRAHLAQIR